MAAPHRHAGHAHGPAAGGSNRRRLDAAACGLSAACLVHCLALPAAASLSPLLGALAGAEWVHWALLALAAPVAVLALLRRSTPLGALLLAGAGLIGLGCGAAGFPSPVWETPLSVAGALLLATAHGVNMLARARRPADR